MLENTLDIADASGGIALVSPPSSRPIVVAPETDLLRLAATPDVEALATTIKTWGRELGFEQIGIADIDLAQAEQRLRRWLELGRHGSMNWMERHGSKRTRPHELLPGTLSIICARMNYLPQPAQECSRLLERGDMAYVSRYALGKDYHRLIRRKLQRLADRLTDRIGPFGYRVFTDSAPVMEKPLAERAGLGWIGKHTNLLSRDAGSWFFLGEIYTDLPLPRDRAAAPHCGTCGACMAACPTGAIVAPYQLDARRCISYLTIEHPGSIPEALRPLIGNRIYGCDDCQLVCPWNKFAKVELDGAFADRHGLAEAALETLMDWSAEQFERRLLGSPIRRIGHARWQRNIAVAMGNAPPGDQAIIACLQRHLDSSYDLVREHVAWALQRQTNG